MPRKSRRLQPRINFLASWARNVNPANRVCSVVATYSEQRRPRMFAARIAFDDIAAAHTWAAGIPAYVKVACGTILGAGGVRVSWLALDVDTARRKDGPPGPHAPSLRRVRAFLAHVRASGFALDYQADNGHVVRKYGDLATFEAALEVVNYNDEAAAPLAYRD